MTKKLKVIKVDKANKTIVVDACTYVKSTPIFEIPIWVGTVQSLEELFGISERLTEEKLKKNTLRVEHNH